MACSLTQGFTPKSCKTVSGTKSFLIAEFLGITAVTKTAGVVTAITKAGGKKFYRYAQKAEVAMWKQTSTIDPKNGAYAFDLEANLDQSTLDQATLTENQLLLQNTVMMIAEDSDGTYWLLGENYGMDAATMGTEGGVAMGDFRGTKIAFKGRNYVPVASVDSTIIAGLLV